MQVLKTSRSSRASRSLAQLNRMKLHTVAQFPVAHPAFTEAALRNLIFKAGARQSSKG